MNGLLRVLSLLAVAAPLAMAAPIPRLAAAQQQELQLPISVDADSVNYEGRKSILVYRGLKVTQGNIGIQADVGRASGLDFEDSVWHLSGNVIIDTQYGHVECEAADLRISEHRLVRATITGSPATFEVQRPENDVVTYAQAGKLVYDFSQGTVEFSDDATITEGGNQISSDYLLYNIEEQRIQAQSGGEGDSKVKITYTPDDADDAETDGEPSEDDSAEDNSFEDDEQESSEPKNEAGSQ